MSSRKSTKSTRTGASKTARSRTVNRSTFAHSRRNHGMALVAVLAVATVSLIGVAVAAFTSDLKINGTATIKGTTWDIHFENLQPVNKSANAEEVTPPTLKQDSNGNNTIIGDYKVKLKYPSDHVEYVFDVTNQGDLDAKITSLTINTGSSLTCNYTTTPTYNVCDKLIYTLKYNNGQVVAVGDTLVHGQTKTMALHLEFDPNASTDYIPNQDVDVSGLGVTITYTQQ